MTDKTRMNEAVYKLVMLLAETNRVDYEIGKGTWYIYGKDGKTDLVKVVTKNGLTTVTVKDNGEVRFCDQQIQNLKEVMRKNWRAALASSKNTNQIMALLENEIASK